MENRVRNLCKLYISPSIKRRNPNYFSERDDLSLSDKFLVAYMMVYYLQLEVHVRELLWFLFLDNLEKVNPKAIALLDEEINEEARLSNRSSREELTVVFLVSKYYSRMKEECDLLISDESQVKLYAERLFQYYFP